MAGVHHALPVCRLVASGTALDGAPLDRATVAFSFERLAPRADPGEPLPELGLMVGGFLKSRAQLFIVMDRPGFFSELGCAIGHRALYERLRRRAMRPSPLSPICA